MMGGDEMQCRRNGMAWMGSSRNNASEQTGVKRGTADITRTSRSASYIRNKHQPQPLRRPWSKTPQRPSDDAPVQVHEGTLASGLPEVCHFPPTLLIPWPALTAPAGGAYVGAGGSGTGTARYASSAGGAAVTAAQSACVCWVPGTEDAGLE